uniref:IMD domain-containing protein n=1 Tax=Monopterus albus TaxID=43700 RepID=A0A3Q3J4T6_MONAL
MSAMNSDRLHRSTLGIYSSLMDELNPSLQKLVSLGNSYVQAFKALAVTSEAYFSALSQIGEKAFYTMSSSSLGDVLIQISESQRRLTLELEGVVSSTNTNLSITTFKRGPFSCVFNTIVYFVLVPLVRYGGSS